MTDRIDITLLVTEANPVPDPVAVADEFDIRDSLLAAIDERSEHVTHTEDKRATETDQGESVGWRRPVLAFAGMAMLLIVVIGSAVLLFGGGGDPIADTTPTTTMTTATDVTSTSEAPSTTVPPAVSPLGVWEWSSATDLGAEGDQYAWSVITHGGGFIAVGQDVGTGEDAAVWLSEDGHAWTQVAVEALNEPGHQRMWDVTVLSDQLIAVGVHDDGAEASAAVWRSVDGSTWERVAHDDVFGGPHEWMWSVTEGGPGVVAVGHQGSFENRDVALWYSADGENWLTSPSEADLAAAGHQVMAAAASTDVVVVAAGYDASGGDRDAAVWISTDGITWEQVVEEALGGSGDQQIMGVTATSDGFVAVGYDSASGGWDAAMWMSPDGYTWTRADHEVFGGDGDQIMNTADQSSEGLIAVGSITIDGIENPAVWATDASGEWVIVEADAFEVTGGISSLAVTENTITAIGYATSDTDTDAAAWTTPPRN